jgi:hypothetical protein
MRTVLKSREFILATVLVIIFSSFSIVISNKVDKVCSITKECSENVNKAAASGELLWDSLLRRFLSSVSFS